MTKRGLFPVVRKLMCTLGYHCYHPSAMEMKYIRNEGKCWVYEVTMQCVYCDKPRNTIISIPKPVKEELASDTLALLKGQEARVMTHYEVRAEYEIVWLDRKDISCEVAILHRIACSMYEFSIMGTDEMPRLLESQYGKTWRCWTSRPDEQVRRDTPWES